MLQQTQVSRAAPAWVALLADLPDPRAAAAAGQAELVRRWDGLGYNRRAVGLHRAAVAMVDRHGGDVPESLDDLLALPGVGPYTARAVLAFAFEHDVGVVDTNVARIISRAVVGAPLGAVALQRVADGLVGHGDGWRHNQAMLDHGALVCTARAPSCDSCVLRRSCAWRRSAGPDPARSTAGTSRPQARFEGSSRQARGAILAVLRSGPAGPEQLDLLRDRLGVDRVDRALEAVVSDGLVEAEGSMVRLAGG
jgi:A/G-specific adenine glycosylase